jgi:hypothetical protein
MLKKAVLSQKLNVHVFIIKNHKVVIGAVAVIATVVILMSIYIPNITNVDTKDITNVDTKDITNVDTKDITNVESDAEGINWLDVSSNEQIIYITPEDIYVNDNVVISVTSHVDSQLYGQGIRFEYRNKSLDELEIVAAPAEDKKNSGSNKSIVGPGVTEAYVLYLGKDTEPFTEGTYTFTITAGENSYTTGSITIKAK